MKTLSWPKGNGPPEKGTRDPGRLKTKHRILVADEDTVFARALVDYLLRQGYDGRTVSALSDAKNAIEFWQPDTVFVAELLPAANAYAIFKFMQGGRLKKVPKVVVMSKHAQPEVVEQMRRAGASHYLIKPFALEEALRAVTLVKDGKPAVAEAPNPAAEEASGTIRELHLLNLFLRQATGAPEDPSSLYNLMRMINMKIKGVRCSLVQCRGEGRGRVLASNDNEQIANLEIDLEKYPEILEVQRLQAPVIIPSVKTSILMRDVRLGLESTPYETIVLFPIYRCGTFFGVLSLRMRQRDQLEIFYVEKFGQVCAQILSLAIAAPGQRLVAE